ncbi:MAG TPA: FkbM family methyltransferase [Opitutaceae bacterium]|jgi:FkbM family methyltransferase
MNLLRRVIRKAADLRAFPRLAWRGADRKGLWALSLVQNRIPGAWLAAGLMTGGTRVVTPALTLSRGQRVRVDLAVPGQRDVFIELFMEQIYDLSCVPFAPSLVADCGAYCGYFSTMAAGRFLGARIVCFEANPVQVAVVRKQLDLLEGRVELMAAAAYVRAGTITFAGSGTGGGVVDGGAAQGSVEVPCVDLAAWLSGAAPESLVLKMDVEGAEDVLLPRVLPALPRRCVLFLETHHPDGACEALLAPYRAAGFSVREVRRRAATGHNFDYAEWVLARYP